MLRKIIQSAALVGLFLAPAFVAGQVGKAKATGKKKAQKEIKTVYDYVDSVGIPEKYKKESVVILGHYEKTRLIKPKEPFKVQGGEEKVSSKYVLESFGITRYLLQDKNALEKFSTYYFNESENSKIGISIIKASGERIDVDMKTAISVSDQASINFGGLNLTLNVGKYKKIALAGLEVGDMLEFNNQQFASVIDPSEVRDRSSASRQNRYSNYNSGSSYYAPTANSADAAIVYLFVMVYFYPQIVSTKHPKTKRVSGITVPEFDVRLNSQYPCLKQRYEMSTIGSSIPFEYTALNGAPQPKISNNGEEQTLSFESEFNDAVTSEYYMMPGNNVPTIRFTYNYKKYEKFGLHFGNLGKGLNDESAQILAKRMISQRWKADGITHFYKIDAEIGKQLKKLNKKEKLKYFYYYYKKNYSLYTYISSRRENLSSQSSLEATKLFQIFCDRYEIPYEMAMYLPRQKGPTTSAVSGDKLMWGLIAYPDKDPVYLTDFDAYSEYNVPSRFMYGSEVFYVDPSKDYATRSEVFSNVAENNKLSVKTIAKVDLANNDLKLSSTYTIGGEKKTQYYGMVNSLTDFYKAYDKMLGTNKDAKEEDDEIDFMQIIYYSDDFREVDKQDAEKDRLRRSFDELSSENENEKFEDFVSENYQTEADVTKVKHLNTGISTIVSEEPENIEFVVEHTLTNTVQKTGTNAIVVDLGKLILQQTEFSELEDRTRKYKVDLNYQQTFTSMVEMAIPEGYTIANLEDFNTKVDNDLIGFTCTAKVENGKLMMTSTKEYKKVHASAQEWSKMMDAMDAAAHQFQKKMLLELNTASK